MGDLTVPFYDRWEKAKEYYLQAIHSGFPCHFELGTLYDQHGHWDEAVKEYAKVSDDSPDRIRVVRRIAKNNTDAAFRDSNDAHAVKCMRDLADLLEKTTSRLN